MKILVPTEDHYLDDRYGKSGKSLNASLQSISFPIYITNPPVDTQSFALTLVDFDAIPVGGFPWIHWLVADIPADTREIPENASRSGVIPFIQGRNSTAGAYVGVNNPEINQHYANPAPPDKDHAYTLTVYALDKKLNLQPGFWMNELYRAMKQHILASQKLELWYHTRNY
ncbi:YbhB/YbcL family Raf kinase inhibitor-like protein [Agrilactobacillus fermenti]|uniref:YbhB/YbcL family Raf kinase inhibitor-like protein n=1 Tax=Agrilactobacillus fermenti TaxID=2586909 RepID=UPI001E46F7C1|nr:YbhB/YbcL family Raf kinase inhibitor-like protein [Agrilactobacillus fermenti]MCD2255997.1 YbhB/YbcL family Raf kinase inhibitor-like protein [Agrilactobacillus fermenti]